VNGHTFRRDHPGHTGEEGTRHWSAGAMRQDEMCAGTCISRHQPPAFCSGRCARGRTRPEWP
jgi:hypothetical protein